MGKITKEISGDKCIYRDEMGKIIDTYQDGIEEIATSQLELLNDFLEMMITADREDVDIDTQVVIAQSLLATAKEKIFQACKYIDENFGRVEIERVRYHQYPEPEKMLGVIFKPVQKAA